MPFRFQLSTSAFVKKALQLCLYSRVTQNCAGRISYLSSIGSSCFFSSINKPSQREQTPCHRLSQSQELRSSTNMATTSPEVTGCVSDLITKGFQSTEVVEMHDPNDTEHRAEGMITSLPLFRYLRSTVSGHQESGSGSLHYQEFRLHSTMHQSAHSTHLVNGSLFGPNKLPIQPYFFIQTLPVTRVISMCYIGTHLTGHPGYVHGGLLFILLDDIFARCASTVFPSRVGMTANLNINYRKPSFPDRVYVIRAELVKTEGRKAWVSGQIRCLDSFDVEEMARREAAISDGISVEEEELGSLVAEANALFVEPKFANSMVPLFHA